MRIHIVECDKCGEEANMRYTDYSGYTLPRRWKHVYENGFEMDLCPHCYKAYKRHLKEFK